MKERLAFSLAAAPGRRQFALDLAHELEERGYGAIYCPAVIGDPLALAEAVLFSTQRITVGTGIANLYLRHPSDLGDCAAFLQEVSGGRFQLGIGVSHRVVLDPLEIGSGRPLADVRRYVEGLRKGWARQGGPPLILAALRRGMRRLAGELAEGMMVANACRSHVAASLADIPAAKRQAGFSVSNMTPVCISEDREGAAAACRRYLRGYMSLPNYQNYFEEAGYGEEVAAARDAAARGDEAAITEAISDRLLADTCAFGPAATCWKQIEAFLDAGVSTPILVPISTAGGQRKAFEEVIPAFAG